MSNLNSLLLKELLRPLPPPETEHSVILSFDDICNLPDHYQLYDEPEELQKEFGFPEIDQKIRSKWASVINKGSETILSILGSNDSPKRIRYPDSVEVLGSISVRGSQKNKLTAQFLRYISKERADEMKAKADEERFLALREFESRIDTNDLKRHIRKWTYRYFEEVDFLGKNPEVINLDAMANSAYLNILIQVFTWYFVTQDKSWEEILDSEDTDIEFGLEHNHFYDYYPLFHKLSSIVTEVHNSRFTLKPRLTDHGKISIKYNWYILRYAKLRCPKMDFTFKYI